MFNEFGFELNENGVYESEDSKKLYNDNKSAFAGYNPANIDENLK